MARHILSGQVIVNGTDIWTVYNAFLREEQKGGHENLNALLAPAKTKGNVAVNIREQNGEEYSADLRPRSEGRNVALCHKCHLNCRIRPALHRLRQILKVGRKRLADF